MVRCAPCSLLIALGATVAIAGCRGPDSDVAIDTDDTVDTELPTIPGIRDLDVTVTLDDLPVGGAIVTQGGGTGRWTTRRDGHATIRFDPSIEGDPYVIASHPSARASGTDPTGRGAVRIGLSRFDPADNPAFEFHDPGTPDVEGTTAQCNHCHLSITASWYASPHRAAASNPIVHDVYSGTAASADSAAACAALGGRWAFGIGPGTGAPAERCYVGDGALPALNPGCVDCDAEATAFGACADCHAPGIDGVLGGRDLLEATGTAYRAGVLCDVCHHVASIDPSAPAGVAGRLVVIRPSEPSPSPSLGTWKPLTFGPWGDVVNPLMESVGRDLFRDGSLCSGCHQLDQAALVPGDALDPDRWPAGVLPVLSTYAEWQASGFARDGTACPACHMPPDPVPGNGADLGQNGVAPGIAAGWFRPEGSVAEHAWYGPRQPESGMLERAATLDVDSAVVGDVLTTAVTVGNARAGHALPTGEPLRTVVVLVDARCGDEPLDAIGGSAVPDFGGALDARDGSADWTRWPGAAVGDVVRVIRLPGGFVDYVGTGPFGDGRFDAAAKGMPVEEVVGQATIVAMAGDVATFDRPLPTGDRAYRGIGTALAEGAPVTARAGAPGFGFARVLVASDGRRMVPHALAVDVASDDRLLPDSQWTVENTFRTTCADPTVEALLVYRRLPPELAAQRGWDVTEQVVAHVTR